MDGTPGTSQKPIKPGGRFVYEFTLHQEGTFFYHTHMAMQEMMGMLGAFILHPETPYDPPVDRDFVLLLQEYAVLANNTIPNTMEMEFNWLTLNGRAAPATTPLIVRLGDRVRMRLINMGMDHHPMHLHGHTFTVTGSEAGRQPRSTWAPANTVLVGVAQARDIEFAARYPGDWMFHCHLPHHMMNQMSSRVGRELITNGPLSPAQAQLLMHHEVEMDVAENAESVPGFPQDAYMQQHVHVAESDLAKPETHGLPAGWSRYMQGMMTLVRILPPQLYDEVMRRREGSQKEVRS
jgi:hypothetical protein